MAALTNLGAYDSLVFISDVHFGAKSSSADWLDNVVSYFDNFFIPLIKKESAAGNAAVVVAGDFFDNRSNIDINVLNKAYSVMENVESVCPVFMMIGNHDIYKKSETDITSLKIFSKFKNVTVIPDKAVVSLSSGKTFLLCSWLGDHTKENKIVARYKEKYDYFVFHAEISGFKYDNGRQITNGMNVSIMDDTCRILSGHIHRRQESPKAMYFGSPFQITRSDFGNEKGIYIFRSSADGVERSFVKNDYSPKFVRAEFKDYGKNVDAWSFIENNYVDIIFDEEELKKFNLNKFSDELRKFNPKEITFITRRTKETDEGKKTVNPDATIDDVFDDNLTERGYDDEFNKKLKELNRDYIKKAEEELGL